MDESAFRQSMASVIERPCSFEKAVLARCVSCARSERVQIAERELVSCQTLASLSRCNELHLHLRRAFAFALGKPDVTVPLPHAQEKRVQCGGLQGIQYVLNDRPEVENVDALLDDTLQQWGALADIPYSEVVHAAARNYKGRHGCS